MRNHGNKTSIRKKKERIEIKGPTVSTATKIPLHKAKYGKSRTEIKGKYNKDDVYVGQKYKTKVEKGLDIIKKDSQEIINNNKIEVKKEDYIPYSCIEKLEENDMTCDEQMLE